MLSKQAKKEQKAAKRAAREEAARKERQKGQVTAVLVLLIVAVGGVLVWFSLDRDGSDVAEGEMTEEEIEELLAELEAGEDADADAGADIDADADADAGADADGDAGADADADAGADAADADGEPADGEPADGDAAPEPGEAGVLPATADPGASAVTPPVDEDRDIACGGDLPEGADAERSAYEGPEVVIEEGVDYVATFVTSCGDITVELLAGEAPTAVNNLAFLAGEGFYDGLEITRIDPGITVLQFGSPTNTQSGGPGYAFPDELDGAAERSYPAGSLAMANSGPNTNGSQFFFVYGDGAQALAPDYTLFGDVVDGAEVMEEIAAIETGGDTGQIPGERVYIETITVEPVS